MNKKQLWQAMKLPEATIGECFTCKHIFSEDDDRPCHSCVLPEIDGWPNWEWNEEDIFD